MNEKLLKYIGWLPLIVIIIYIFGYLSLSAYLESFGIDENINLDVNLIKIGILYSIIIGPIVLLCYSTFKVGDYSNTDPDLSNDVIHTLHDALGYSLLYSLSLGSILFKVAFDVPTDILLISFSIGFILNKITTNNQFIIIFKGIFLFIPFFALVICIFNLPITGKHFLYILQQIIFLTCCALRIFNKRGITFQISHVCIIITVLISTASSFGSLLLINIPSKYGGEIKNSNTYYVDSAAIKKFKKTGLKNYLRKDSSIVISTVYETSEKYYFITPKKANFLLTQVLY